MSSSQVLMKTNKESWVSVDSTAYDKNGRTKIWQLPEEIGAGQFISHPMERGVDLTVSSIRLTQALKAQLEAPKEKIYLVFSLQGSSINKNSFFKEGFAIRQGKNALYWSPDQELLREAAKGETLQNIVITFPKTMFRGHKNGSGFLHKKGALFEHTNTPAINLILQQILNCPFSGSLRELFLESKALELIALKWAFIESVPISPLSREQLEGVEKVKELLVKNIQNPPSIHFLAKNAGMSHPVLNRCFKRVTGYSMFEFLRRQRLELSRDMVESSAMSMTEIAYTTGFANSSHFTRAFTACYGLSPSRYRKQSSIQ